MTLSATQQQTLIVFEVGDVADGRVAANVAAIWSDYADKALIDYRLQRLYTVLRCAQLVLGYYVQQVDFQASSDISMKNDQRTQHVRAIANTAQCEITALETKARSRRGGATGTLTTTEIAIPPAAPNAPIPNPWIDATDPVYAGSPYFDVGIGAAGPPITDITVDNAL